MFTWKWAHEHYMYVLEDAGNADGWLEYYNWTLE